MTQSFQTVFGSQDLLAGIIDKSPRPSYLLKPSSPNQANMLLDMSGRGDYSTPIKFNVVREHGEIHEGEYVHCMYFYITHDEEKLFINQMNKIFEARDIYSGMCSMFLGKAADDQIQYLLLSSWENSTDFFTMKETPAFTPLRQFTTRAADSGGYHETGYKVLAPSEYRD